MKKISVVFAVITMFSASAMATSSHNGPSKGGDSNATSISGAASKAEARSASTSKSKSSATGGAGGNATATGGNATASGGAGGQGGTSNAIATGGSGGQGGNATNGGQSMNFSGSDMGKLAPDVSPPSMPSVTPCTTGMSGGISIGGVGVSGGGYSYDDLCGWERQHAVAVATGDQVAAVDIKHGMTMLRCQRMSPDDRKFFKACDALPKEEGKTANPAFQSN